MVAIIEDKSEDIAALCRRFGVAHLYAFGSAVTGDYRPGESDVDLLVDFGDMGGRAKAHAYFALLDELRSLLETDVDLVMVGAVKNRYIARDIERTKQELYAASTGDPDFIAQHGRASALLMSAGAYERTQRELEILRILAQGEADIAAGVGVDLETVMAEADAD